jgi:hypothetical protein
MKKNYKRQLAQDMVSRFRKEFFDIFGVYPRVDYSFRAMGLPRVSLSLLEDLVNEVLQEHHPKYSTPMGIRHRSRKRPLVLHRQSFFKIAKEVGYGPLVSATHIGFDHANAIHGTKIMKSLLEIQDPLATKVYNTILDAYKKRFSDDGDVQQDSSGESDTERVLPSLLYERIDKPVEPESP